MSFTTTKLTVGFGRNDNATAIVTLQKLAKFLTAKLASAIRHELSGRACPGKPTKLDSFNHAFG